MRAASATAGRTGPPLALALFVCTLSATFEGAAHAADKKQCLESAERGQDLRDRGKLLMAKEQFLVCVDAGCPPPVPTYCAEWLEDVTKRIPSLSVRVTDSTGANRPAAKVFVDDKLVTSSQPIELDPGTHQVRAEDDDGDAPPQSVTLAFKEKHHEVSLRLEPSRKMLVIPPIPDVTIGRRVVPKASWVAWGVGAIGLIGFSIFGVEANGEYSHYKSTCAPRCSAHAHDDVERTMVVADTMLVIGLVGAAVGTILYFASPESKPRLEGGR